MRTLRYCFTAAACSLLLIAHTGYAQGLKLPAPSPGQTVKQNFALSAVEVNYSRPVIKGRSVGNEVAPFNKVWRTGANNATTITFGEDVSFGGVPVKAGKYGLLSIPGQSEWTVILTKDLEVTSPANYKEANDVARVKVAPEELPFSVESFLISFDRVLPTSMSMILIWDKTAVPVEITAKIDDKVMNQIDEAMKGDKKPYFEAAYYYLENGKDLKKALDWADAASKATPDGYWVFHLKAKIQAKTGDKNGAKASAEKSIELAKAAKNDDYVTMNNKLIAGL